MEVLSEEKSKLVAERNGWSLAYAKGTLEGEAMHRSGKSLSMYVLVGIDDYARGFRAGYFQRRNAGPKPVEDRRGQERTPNNVRPGHVEVATDSTDYPQNVAR